jgi:hypothetical protein
MWPLAVRSGFCCRKDFLMIRYFPIALGVVAIFALTAVQSVMSDRFVETNVTAVQRAKLLENVPMKVGDDWIGEDMPVTEEVRDTAGAIGCVSRVYTNQRTNRSVRLWLIVGHSRDISAHTPDICFPSSGFSQRSTTHSLYTFDYGQSDPTNAKFWTNTFFKEDSLRGRELERVFWAWYNPRQGAPVAWQAETNPHGVFGNSRALFKMYFTSSMKDINETTEESPAQKFGVEFLPIINRILSESDIHTDDTKEVAKDAA